MEQRQQQLEKQGTRKAAMESKRTSEPPQSCPRCESTNTKFCYYNNYSSSQPRYFCRTCRRYWTQGGTLRNLPHASSAVRRAVKQCKRPSSASFSVASVSTSVMPLYHRMSTGVERPPWCMSDGDELVRQPIGYEVVDSSMLVGSRIPPAQPQMAGVLNPAAGEEEDGVLGRVFGRFEDGSGGEGGDRRMPSASLGRFFE